MLRVLLLSILLLSCGLTYTIGYSSGYVYGNDDGYMERRAEEAIDYPPVDRYKDRLTKE